MPSQNTKIETNKKPYNPYIDGLRAISVLSVLLFHIWPKILPGGFIGVDIFFVISGFLITGILLKHFEAGDFTFKEFYERRIRRLFPSLLIIKFMSILYGFLVLTNQEFKGMNASLFYNSIFIVNIHFYKLINYFDVSATLKPFLHLWSLSVEEQFYFVFPLFIFILYRFNIKKRIMLLSICLIAIYMFISNLYFISFNPSKAYYMARTRGWEIMIGSILAFCSSVKNLDEITPKNLKNYIPLIGLGLIFFSLFSLSELTTYPATDALLPTLGGALVILGGQNSFINKTILSTSLLTYIGRISYPLYLIHWPLISFVNIIDPQLFTYLHIKLVIILLSFFIAHLLYSKVEYNIRFKGFISTKILVALWIGTSLTTFILYKTNNITYFDQTFKERALYIDEAIKDWEYPPKGTKNISLKNPKYLFYQLGENRNSVLFLGDSHMEEYAVYVNSLVQKYKNRGAIFATIGGAFPVPNVFRKPSNGYDDFVENAINLVEEYDIKTIVISSSWIGYLSQGEVSDYFVVTPQGKLSIGNPKGREMALRFFEDMIASWINQKRKVYIVLPKPQGEEYDPKKFVSRDFLGNWNVDIKDASYVKWNEYSKPTYEKLESIAQRTGAYLLYPSKFLCTKKICKTHENLNPLYKDGGHLRSSKVKGLFTIFDFLFR